MLLKEINKSSLVENTQPSEPPSTGASPIKPLNTPLLKEVDQSNSTKRDFNSSSDTYVSEQETSLPQQSQEPHLDSFQRNFEADMSADLTESASDISGSQPQDTFEDHKSNDLLPESGNLSTFSGEEQNKSYKVEQNTAHNEQPDVAPDLESTIRRGSSPSKSIMKAHSMASASPKKNVAFPAGSELQTYHSYPTADDEHPISKKLEHPAMAHLWTEVETSFDDNDAENTLPPLPPPHSSNTVTGLLNMGNALSDDEAHEEPDISQLTEYKLTHKNFSNLSLNEKIDVFLNSKPHDDLNEHLDNLGKAASEETDVNIHRLSFQLANHETSDTEKPIHYLGKGQDFYLNSAHSSQSSLQSLVDSNKYLHSSHIERQSKGLQLNDGIKGFSDKIAAEIIPTTLESAESSRDLLAFEPSFSSKPDNVAFYSAPGNLTNSLNQKQAEKSILNLLDSVSQINLGEALPEFALSEVIPLEDKVADDKTQSSKELEADQDKLIDDQDQPVNPSSHSEVMVGFRHEAEKEDTPLLSEKVSSNKEEKLPFVKVELEPQVKTEQENDGFIASEIPVKKIKIEPKDNLVKSEPLDSELKEEPSEQNFKEEELDAVLKTENSGIIKTEEPDEIPRTEESDHLLKIDQSMNQNHNNITSKTSVDNDIRESFPHDQSHESPMGMYLESDCLSKPGSISDLLPMAMMVDNDFDAIEVQVDKAIFAGQVKLVGPNTMPTSSFNLPSNWKDDTSLTDTVELADESGDVSNRALETQHHTQLKSSSKIIAGSKKDHVTRQGIDENQIPSETSKTDVELEEGSSVTGLKTVSVSNSAIHGLTSSDYDSSILANSSNIQPPFNIKLPTVELSDTDFDELNKRLNEKSLSFEESLSAEYDAEKKSLNFISIWHSQHLLHKTSTQRSRTKFYQVPSILSYNTADLSQCAKFHIPQTLKPKKIQEVNLISAKVVSLNDQDFYDSGFLPELSQDSGIQDHFEVFLKDDSLMNDKEGEQSNMKNVTVEKIEPERINRRRLLYKVTLSGGYSTLKPRYQSPIENRSGAKKSRFEVPSFAIKRSSSVLSPKNMYNDIFHDGSFVEPQTQASEIETTTAPHKDKIRKFMDVKDAITHTGTSQIKMVGKTAIAHMKTTTDHAKIPQKASIHCDSLVSETPRPEERGEIAPVLPTISANPFETNPNEQEIKFVSTELIEEEVPELNQFQREKNQSKVSKILFEENLNSNNPFLSNIIEGPAFPDPDPELVATSFSTPAFDLKVSKQRKKDDSPVKASLDTVSEKRSPVKLERSSTRGSPIKINSPVRLVKKGEAVTGIVLDKQIPEFKGKDIKNTVNILRPQEKKHSHCQSTVSVPTLPVSTADTLLTTVVDILSQNGLGTPLKRGQSKSSTVSGSHPLEKGKLFIRVMGLKNVFLPDFKDRSMLFNITLDNGIHCVKTSNYQANGSASISIDKEFELTVNDSLEFILTLKATYEKPKATLVEVKERRVVQSRNKLGRLFGSKDVITRTRFVPKETEDPWQTLLANDGLFARCYVDLEQYLGQVTGLARNFNLTCFNEWATYSDGAQRKLKSPYPIAELEVKMLYVPRTERYEILPSSIKFSYECLDELKKEKMTQLEGYLHQEGGDCDSWKKRWFQLKGTSLIAHSEYSHKTRAKINLTKVAEVVYIDQENINRSSTNYRNFSDILLMEHSFKIRFTDGEIIDFGAPNKQEKTLWINAIQEIVYRNKFRRLPWVKMMLEKNEVNKRLIKVS